MAAAGVRRVEDRAAAESGENTSEMLRRLVKFGLANMPKGYR
jgi:hypothetical protein